MVGQLVFFFFKANISESGTLQNDICLNQHVKHSISKNGSLKNDRGVGKWGGVGGLECSQATLLKRVPFLLPKFLGLSPQVTPVLTPRFCFFSQAAMVGSPW